MPRVSQHSVILGSLCILGIRGASSTRGEVRLPIALKGVREK